MGREKHTTTRKTLKPSISSDFNNNNDPYNYLRSLQLFKLIKKYFFIIFIIYIMATHHRRKSAKTHRRHRRKSHKRVHRGGATSAASHAMSVVGGPEEQMNAHASSGGQTSNHAQPDTKLIQSAGRRRRNHSKRNHSKRHKRGGILGHVVNQAIVPLSILAMQQRYRRNSTHSRKR